MTIVIIKRGKKGKGAPNLETRGAGARIIVVLFLIIKKTFREAVISGRTKKRSISGMLPQPCGDPVRTVIEMGHCSLFSGRLLLGSPGMP